MARVRRTGESGFILLESMITIALITVIMGAVGAEYVSGLTSTNHARLQSVAVQVAGSTVDQIQGLHPSDLLTGRGSSAVDTERGAVSTFTTVAGTSYEAYDSTTSATSTGTTFSTIPTTTTVGAVTYTVYRYFECTSPASSGSCLSSPSQSSLTANNIRVIVVVTWPQRGCPTVTTAYGGGATCSYSTSTVINADDDLTFDLNQPLPQAPIVSNTSALTVAVGDAINYQMTVQNNTGVAPVTWAVTSGTLPSGLTMTTTGLITGTVTGSTTTNTSTITATDAFLRTASDTITWTVEPPLAIAQLADQSSIIGATVSKTLTASGGSGSGYAFTDPNSTLPPGLSLSSGGVISGTITKTANTTYPATYAVTITAADSQACPACVSTPRTTTMSFRWTVSVPPLSVTNPGAQRWTVNTLIASSLSTSGLPLSASGGDGIYVYTVTGLPTGVTVNPLTGNVTGIPLVTGSGTATITVSDVLNGVTVTATTSFTWTVFAYPTITTPANQSGSIGAAVSLTVANTCPNTTCTYTAANLPTGLAVNSSTGVISGTIGGSAKTYSLISVTVTDYAGAAATTSTFSWTVVGPPTIAGLGTQAFTETGVQSVPVTYTCPLPSCTISLSGSMPGLGLTTSSTASGDLTSATSLTTSRSSGTVYIGGTVQNTAVTGSATSAAYTPQVAIASSDNSVANSASTTWTAYTVPTLTSPGAQTTTRYATVTVGLGTTCPNGTCTYTLNNAPAGLSISSSAVISGTVTSSPQVFANVTVTATDSDGVSTTSAAFTWTVTATTNNLAALVNNIGVTADANTSVGNYDGNGYSYSATALSNANVTAGSTVNYGGLSYQWPVTAGTGQNDNVVPRGQTVTITGNGSSLGFLTSAVNGSSTGTGTITYTDGTTQSFSLTVPDWVPSGTASNVAISTTYRNATGNTKDSHTTVVFGLTVALNAAKTVASVTLPAASTTTTAMHIFAMSLTSAGLANSFNNIGITTPGSTVSAGFDAGNNTFSKTALTSAGAAPGGTVTSNGIGFTWPSTAGTSSADNVLAYGQTIAPTTTLSGTTLGFLLASNGASTTGSGTITYTDGTTQSFSLTAPAWDSTSGGSTAVLSSSSYDTRTVGYNLNLGSGSRYVYYSGVALTGGKTIATVTLPAVSASVSSNAMHIFAMAVK